MLIEIHDVGHGACAMITCPNGARVLVDCGLHTTRPWSPSVEYGGSYASLMIVQNLDEDHVEDLARVWKHVSLGALYTNPTVTAEALASMKADGGMGSGIQTMHAILDRFGPGLIGDNPDLGGVSITCYHNVYGVNFTDTNNLSLATFVRLGKFTIMFAGDLETAGWRALLGLPAFVADLSRVNILVASHHGRANGRCPEVFELVRPAAVVFSDDAKHYDTQVTDGWYRRRVLGLRDAGATPDPITGYPRRHVLTTRRDGTIAIRVTTDGRRFLVTPTRRSATLPAFGLPAARRQAYPGMAVSNAVETALPGPLIERIGTGPRQAGLPE